MKKLSVLVVALFLMTSSIYAKGKYSGDVRVHAGASLDWQGEPLSWDFLSLLGNIDVQSWNFFELNDDISAGFFVSFDGGAGKHLMEKAADVNRSTGELSINYKDPEDLKAAFSFSMLLGPAISFKFGNAAKINIGAGLAVNFIQIIEYGEKYPSEHPWWGKSLYDNYASVGFGLDVNVKFRPDAKVSPVVGYRFSICDCPYSSIKYPDVNIWMSWGQGGTVIKNTACVGVAFNL